MEDPTIDEETLELAAQDVRRVLERQKEERQILITQMNILFVTNSAMLSFLTISKLITIFSIFSALEILLFFINFLLLIWALLPRKFFVSPNLEKQKENEEKKEKLNFPEDYLIFTPQEYNLQMLADFRETYNNNQKQVDDISLALKYATGVTAGIAMIALLHQVTVYFIPELQKL
ncbi:hypothetical protein LC653_21435 [Nostoc sp. CHAB 5784]|uniref:hypothetical protein n=1 Tax=Nostoc mirabile TaxID=2907820 RepID=UPI001E4A01DE|nr:hypothetical protein [Nostoc mirabile]MCC5666408.1 hypothetical protein [Nostoc mirabile CHAB5784]